jgi:hypothetical protein
MNEELLKTLADILNSHPHYPEISWNQYQFRCKGRNYFIEHVYGSTGDLWDIYNSGLMLPSTVNEDYYFQCLWLKGNFSMTFSLRPNLSEEELLFIQIANPEYEVNSLECMLDRLREVSKCE